MLPGYFAKNFATTSFVEGEVIELVTITALPVNSAAIALSIASKVASLPAMVGKRKRAVSYKSNTAACTLAEVPPFVIGLNVLPSNLIGRPSRTLATTLTTSPSCTYVVA